MVRARRVEYHFLRDVEPPVATAACGEYVGYTRPKAAPRPWPATATFAGTARLKPCQGCVAALEGVTS